MRVRDDADDPDAPPRSLKGVFVLLLAVLAATLTLHHTGVGPALASRLDRSALANQNNTMIAPNGPDTSVSQRPPPPEQGPQIQTAGPTSGADSRLVGEASMPFRNANPPEASWPAPDQALRAAILRKAQQRCEPMYLPAGGSTAGNGTKTTPGPAVGVRIIGFGRGPGRAAVAGQWQRFWLLAVDAGGQRLCNGGAPQQSVVDADVALPPQEEIYDVAVEGTVGGPSPGVLSSTRIAVDRVLYVGYGVTEVQCYIRHAGTYTARVDIFHTGFGARRVPKYSGPLREGGLEGGLLAGNGDSSSGGVVSALMGPDFWDRRAKAPPSDAISSDKVPAQGATPSSPITYVFTERQTFSETKGIFDPPPAAATITAAAAPPRPLCTAPLRRFGLRDYKNRFRFGSWVRLNGSKCDGIHCVVAAFGSPPAPKRVTDAAGSAAQQKDLPRGFGLAGDQSFAFVDTEGWLWASDVCVMVFFADGLLASRAVLQGRWVLGWGSSVLKQPMANFIEERLKVPVMTRPFPVFMKDLPRFKKVKKIPGFFSYRTFDRVIPTANASSETAVAGSSPTTRLTLKWAGCASVTAAPGACRDASMGMGTWPIVAPLLTASLPDVFLLEFSVWRHPLDDELAHLQQAATTLRRIDAAVTALSAGDGAGAVRYPLLLWHSRPMTINQNRTRDPKRAPHIMTTTVHSQWVYEDMLNHPPLPGPGAGKQPSPPPGWAQLPPEDRATLEVLAQRSPHFIFLSRHYLSLPFHIGDEYCHFGLHYGASLGMCYTGGDRKGYLDECVRKTWVDRMLTEQWVNALTAHQQS